MCGIAGVAGSIDRNVDQRTIAAMTQSMARRGPDAEGIASWDAAILGHRRLAVFDLSDAGRQPMLSDDERVGVVFNGAIYNFRDLRRELESRGCSFRSQTDTEVLVHGYRVWGIDGLVRRLHGMFAFAIWDDARRTLFLVRDRLGVKPIVFAKSRDRIVFASTTQALEAAGCTAGLDPQAVLEYLDFGFVTDSRSIYCGIEKVPAAHILEWHDGALTSRQYWSVPPSGDLRMPFQDAVDQAERLFLEAVRMRLDADVPVGALLSGGIDSSLVCWAISKLGHDLTAFSIATPGDEWDESADAAATARELGIRHRILRADSQSVPTAQTLVDAYGEPFACASAIGMLSVSEAVKAEATVLLTGDGGDDVFLGYPRNRHFAAAQHVARSLPPGSDVLWKRMRGAIPQRGALRRAAHFADYATGGLGAAACAHDGLPFYQERGMLGDRLRGLGLPWRSLPWSLSAGRRVLDDYLDFERSTRFVGEYMTKVDGGTTYYGLEARSPFLDQSLWEFASSLPYSVRLHRGRLKAILRELANRHISERVATGAKRGFGIPVQRWISGRWKKDVQSVLADSILAREGWMEALPLQKAVRSLREGETAPLQLWYAFVLEEWLRRHETTRSLAAAG